MSRNELYLDLMKRVLTNVIYRDAPLGPRASVGNTYVHDIRIAGKDWPSVAHTMVGLKRLDNLQECVEQVLIDGVPGDFIETGVWRGGSCIFMRAILKAHNVQDRTVWVADSFAGMPHADEDWYPGDQSMAIDHFNDVLSVSIEQVKENFRRYDLLDDQVEFLQGWFADTLPTASVKELAVLRLDGDLYESTMTTLTHLYPKLSVGGYIIVDDYELPICQAAIHDYRGQQGIEEDIVPIDDYGVYWRRMD